MVFIYTYTQATIWWLCHIAAMFWGLHFPFQAHRFEVMNKTKYIHLTVILLGLFLPLIPVVVSFATGGFDFVRFPPIVCTAASRTATFYSLVSPTAIAAATGLMLLVFIFWTISKVNYTILRSLEPRPSPHLQGGGKVKWRRFFLAKTCISLN